MTSAIALWYCSASLLIQKHFGGVPIATGTLLVAIPKQIDCKRGKAFASLQHRAFLGEA